MAFIDLKYYSNVLGMQTEAAVILPQADIQGEYGTDNANVRPGPYKCLYLLHGLSDDHSIWMRRTAIERYASQYGIAVVMPRADKNHKIQPPHSLHFSAISRILAISDTRWFPTPQTAKATPAR